MKLFNTKNLLLNEVSNEPFKLERDIQELIEKNLDTIFGYLFISSELTVQKYRLDTLCFDEENNSFVIIEYKKGSSYSVIDQGYTYLQLLLNNKSEFLLTLSQYFNRVLKIEDVDWSQSRVIFISPSFNSYQMDSVNFKNLPFELWEINKFSNGVVILDQHHSTSQESIEFVSDPMTQGVMMPGNLVSAFEQCILNKRQFPYRPILNLSLKQLIHCLQLPTQLLLSSDFNILKLSNSPTLKKRY